MSTSGQLHYQEIISNISYSAVLLTGTIMGLVRTQEPYYRFLMKSTVLGWFGIVLDEPSEGISAEQLTTFLSSSLNIELVYIILTGITKFASKEQTKK